MSKVEKLKLLHYTEFFPGGSFGKVAEKCSALTPAEKQILSSHVRSLTHHLRSKGRKPTGGVLLDLVCLASLPGSLENPGRALKQWRGEFTQKDLDRAAFWLEAVTRRIRSYESLPLADRASLSSYAKRQGIDLPLETNDEPLKLLAALGRLRERDPSKASELPGDLPEAYRQLSIEEGHQLGKEIIEVWKAAPDAYRDPDQPTGLVEDVLLHLACLVPGALKGLHEDLIRGGMLYPDELYRDANAEARDHLIRLVETPPHNREVLRPLAWIGDEVVQATFHRWRESRPAWDPEVGWRVDQYFARDAGWELTQAGSRRDLCHQECYRLVPVNEAPAADVRDPDAAVQPTLFPELPARTAGGPVGVITPHEEECRWCGQPLVTLFDLDLRDPRLSFVAPGWRRLRIAMCDRCTLFGSLFTEVDEEGGSHWSRLNVRPHSIGTEEHGWRLPQRRLVLGPRRRSPLEARAPALVEGGSQIGGYPKWEQGNSHPGCPSCGRWMVFVGQIETSEALGEPAEGFTYAFLCQDCRIAATTYEQT